MDITNFKTKAEIRDITMPKVLGNNQYKHNFIVALDGGYSSVKGISENVLFVFPSYAKKVSSIDIVGKLNPTDMILVNHLTNETWLVGSFAENTMDVKDIQATTDESLYTRYRYKSEIYRTIMTTGLGLGLFKMENNLDGLTICLQTGLPSAYVKTDAKVLKEVLSGEYDFSLRVGSQTKHFKFTLEYDNIGVMEQPRGTLANIVYDKEGHLLPDMKDILNSDTLILDDGFGTEDIFSIRSGSNIKDNKNKTFSDTAMKSVFELTANEINDKYDTEFKVFELQKYLKRGEVPVVDRTVFPPKTIMVPFLDRLAENNRRLCEKSVRRLLEEYHDLLDYQYLVITGGTGESRIDYIREMLQGIPGLQIYLGNHADPSISSIYSNVRGYYMSMLLKVQKAMRSA